MVFHPEIEELFKWNNRISDSCTGTRLFPVNGCDLEVVKIGEGQYLASNTDTLSDEILSGLYKDPYTMGYVASEAFLSDFAAGGGIRPHGINLSVMWDYQWSHDQKIKLMEGLYDSLDGHKLILNGGDWGNAAHTVVGLSGHGLVTELPLDRMSAQLGDLIVLAGQLGSGAALALDFLFNHGQHNTLEKAYRPKAQLGLGKILKGYVSSCIDTSDGLIQAIAHMKSFHPQMSIELIWNDEVIRPSIKEYFESRSIGQFASWVVEHGDYQLLFSINEKKLKQLQELVPDLHIVGKFIQGKDQSRIKLNSESNIIEFSIEQLVKRLFDGRFNQQLLAYDLIKEFKQRGLP